MNNFAKRTISGICFGVVMLAALLTNRYVYGAVMLFALVVMMWEFLRMTCGSEYKYSQLLSIFAGVTLFTLVYLYRGFAFPGRLVMLAMIPVFILMVNSLYVKDKSRFDKFANLYTAIIYIAVPWSLLNFAAFSPEGIFNGRLLLCFFIIIWGSDVGAYIFGMALGQKYGKKLFPSISPKKSWIGFWGGFLMAIGLSVVLYYTELYPFASGNVQFGLANSIILAILLNVAGVYGDLIESQWKRHFDIKDSGNLIPGHGGLMDRFDSALVAIPVGIIYLVVWGALCL